MRSIRNVFACLVHESQECVIDLVRNLHALDPSSVILLYNGGNGRELLDHNFPFERYGAMLHPSPRPAVWGRLHQFALDSMEYALESIPFDTFTIVDSDQLATRAGYSDYLARYLDQLPGRIGLLGNAPEVQPSWSRHGPTQRALQEIELWRPFLQRFPLGEQKFVHWSFWPTTVFTADTARDLTRLFQADRQLQEIMERTRIWASEELILPTLVALLGYDLAANPCSYDYVKFRSAYTLADADAALSRKDVFWMHPVPRRYEDPLRRCIRERFKHYQDGDGTESQSNAPARNGLLLTLPILARMRAIEGWLDDAEADLLIITAAKALSEIPDSPAMVEIGSYCGRSTVVLGSVLQIVQEDARAKLYAIDPHDGKIGALDQAIQTVAPTFEKFKRNIAAAGLEKCVEPIRRCSFQVAWNRPISYLFIDHLHDYANVARDFYHFERWLMPGGYVAFHDYADYYPGVKTFVNEILSQGHYEKVHCALSTIVLRKSPDAEIPVFVETLKPYAESVEGPAVISNLPMASCLMPTANRREFVPQAIEYFLRQDYPNRELIVLDDGNDRVADLIPRDDRVRYVPIDQRQTMGAKHNLGCELARGEVIVHWDDDDWMADWRVSYQVTEVLSQPATALSGLANVLFYNPGSSRAWQYIYPPNQQPWVYGGTFCYRKEFWQDHPHPDMNEGADTVLVWGLRFVVVHPLANRNFFVAIMHPHNTSPKRTEGFGWHDCRTEEVHALLDGDLPFYENLWRGIKAGA